MSRANYHHNFLTGKWHLGLNCESRNDHCHHPNNHGFDYFYGLPFTLFNDCKSGEGSEVLVDIQLRLRDLTVLLGLALLTLVCVCAAGLLDVSGKALVLLALLWLLAFGVWYVPFRLHTWNCILMRNQDVVEQPMNLETLSERLIGEAEQFVER